MKKLKTEAEELVSFKPGGTDRSIRELAAATRRLTLRRQRDSLPGKIVTRRLVLRPPMRGDVPDLVRLADNRAIADPMSRMPHPYTRADAVGFVEIVAQRDDERPYAITSDGRFLGVVGLSFAEGRPPELGYWLGEPHWGQGFASEAVKGLVDAVHRIGHFELVAARVRPGNAASRRVLEKAGFTPTGEEADADGLLRFELRRPRWM